MPLGETKIPGSMASLAKAPRDSSAVHARPGQDTVGDIDTTAGGVSVRSLDCTLIARHGIGGVQTLPCPEHCYAT